MTTSTRTLCCCAPSFWAASLTAAALGVVSLLVLGSISHRASVTARQRREREAFRRSYAPGMI